MILRFLLGLVFGSFFSSVSYRYPRGLQFSKGRSFCPKCKKIIRWYDNIPLISYLFLRGRCRNCKKSISFRYPLIELTTGMGFLVIGFNIPLLFIFSILLLIFIIDFEHQIIPDTLIFAGLTLSFFIPGFTPFPNLFAGFLFALFLLLIHLMTRGRGMGLGDVKFAVFGGALIGLSKGVIWLFLSFLTGAIVAIILVLWRKKNLKDKIAFGPFLVIGIPLSVWLTKYISPFFVR